MRDIKAECIFIEGEIDFIRRKMAQLVIQQSDIDQQLRELDRKEMRLQRELGLLNR